MLAGANLPAPRGFRYVTPLRAENGVLVQACIAEEETALKALRPLLDLMIAIDTETGQPIIDPETGEPKKRGAVVAAEEINRAVVLNCCPRCGGEQFIRRISKDKSGNIVHEIVCVADDFASPVEDRKAVRLSPLPASIVLAMEIMRKAMNKTEEYTRRVYKRSYWWGSDTTEATMPTYRTSVHRGHSIYSTSR